MAIARWIRLNVADSEQFFYIIEEREEGYVEAEGRYSSFSGGDRQVARGEERG